MWRGRWTGGRRRAGSEPDPVQAEPDPVQAGSWSAARLVARPTTWRSSPTGTARTTPSASASSPAEQNRGQSRLFSAQTGQVGLPLMAPCPVADAHGNPAGDRSHPLNPVGSRSPRFGGIRGYVARALDLWSPAGRK